MAVNGYYLRFAIVVRIVGPLLPFLLVGGDLARCRLNKGLYDDRLASQKQDQPDRSATGALLPAGITLATPASKLTAIDDEYRKFLFELSDATTRKDATATQACCDEANGDRAGALFCQIVTYLNGGRTGSTAFLKAFPSTKKATTLLWDLDAIAADQGKSMFPPRGPSYQLIDELFLLVLDGQEQAISKYFSLSIHTTGENARYMDNQIKLFLQESQFVVIDRWPILRRYRQKLNSVFRMIVNESSSAEMQQKTTRAVQTFCEKTNPDCAEILDLYGVK
jgi:hypothetical protein